MHVVLTKPVSFIDFNRKAWTIPANTTVLLDAEGVAEYQGVFFDLDPSEYSLNH